MRQEDGSLGEREEGNRLEELRRMVGGKGPFGNLKTKRIPEWRGADVRFVNSSVTSINKENSSCYYKNLTNSQKIKY